MRPGHRGASVCLACFASILRRFNSKARALSASRRALRCSPASRLSSAFQDQDQAEAEAEAGAEAEAAAAAAADGCGCG